MSLRDALKVYVPIALLVAVGFVVAYRFVDPAPPTSLKMATGSPDGAYHAFGQRYREILARDGVILEIVPTAGSVENLRLLQADDGVDIAFVQGGVGDPDQSPNLVSLASVFYEPLWVFLRADGQPWKLSELAGKRVAIGSEGSGVQRLAIDLMAANGIGADAFTALAIGGQAAVTALLAGEIDAAFFVTANVRPLMPLIDAPDLRLLNFVHADAYKLRFKNLASVTLPAAAIDLDGEVPPEDLTLLAPVASLVARDDLHPALTDLLLRAADEIHRPRALFNRPNEFPSANFIDYPLDSNARRYLASGPSFLRRYLPFRVAAMVERLWVMVLPLLTLAIPLARFAPPAYSWQVRRRIYRWYKHLRRIERRSDRAADAEARRALLGELEELQQRVGEVKVPLSYAEDLYHLRLHIMFVRQRLEDPKRAM
ncbi:MAG TPA: TAXI family TRAP transporter solute-binding subunit [Alphaproteobacteria bacterium]|nr:TAXI family TRAP transporter solute-binding subunit [Alphaproteobacteria bacterium]